MDLKIQAEQKKFEAYLNQESLRSSRARREVFKEAMATHGHFTAEEMAKACQQRHVSRATVYRTIKEMLEAGIIRETAFGHKHQHYEHLYDEKPHHHAACLRCGKHCELPDLEEEKTYQKELDKIGFHAVGHEMHFYGICKNCQ